MGACSTAPGCRTTLDDGHAGAQAVAEGAALLAAAQQPVACSWVQETEVVSASQKLGEESGLERKQTAAQLAQPLDAAEVGHDHHFVSSARPA